MFIVEDELKKLPDSPGVSMHKDSLGTIIYVGKAISLKNRVRQYFQKLKKISKIITYQLDKASGYAAFPPGNIFLTLAITKPPKKIIYNNLFL